MKTQSIFIAMIFAAFIPMTAVADNGLIISASVGSAELSEAFDEFDIDASSTAYRFTVGWRFNDYLTVEGGYHNFGRFEQTTDINGTPVNVSLKADGFTLGGVGNLPISDRVSLFARAGAFFWDGDAEINNVTEATPDETNFYFGVGARLALAEKFSATLDGSRYDLDGTSSTVLSIGLDYRF